MTTDKELRIIKAEDLVAIENFIGSHPLKVDLVYSKAEHKDNLFKTSIYRADAKMLVHKELVPIILRAADLCFERTGLLFELKDCLRPIEAQALMLETDIVKAHPHWIEEGAKRLLTPPGGGSHPRGMAVDIILINENGDEVDMGTPFDYLTEDRENNPAARSYTKFSDDESYNQQILKNRGILKDAMLDAGKELGVEVWPLTEEWWDFRLMSEYTNLYAPISDKDLPPDLRMTKEVSPPSPSHLTGFRAKI